MTSPLKSQNGESRDDKYDGHPSFKKLVSQGYQVITF